VGGAIVAFSRFVEKCNARLTAVVLLLGSLLGGACTYVATVATKPLGGNDRPIISETTKARNIAPNVLPPRMSYGAPYVQSRIHPVLIAAAMAQFSLFAMLLFPAKRRHSGAPKFVAEAAKLPKSAGAVNIGSLATSATGCGNAID
jgi:hypothetical protein